MKTNFILIDLENVQPTHLDRLQGLPVEIRIFLGPHQAKRLVELVKCLQPLGKAVDYFQLSANGKNALDFHIAFYLGQLAAEHRGAVFHVISKDTGFDPLITHLGNHKITCHRWAKIEQIPLVKAAFPALPQDEPLAAMRSLLANPKAPKPKTLAKLRNHLKSHLKAGFSDLLHPKVLLAHDDSRQRLPGVP